MAAGLLGGGLGAGRLGGGLLGGLLHLDLADGGELALADAGHDGLATGDQLVVRRGAGGGALGQLGAELGGAGLELGDELADLGLELGEAGLGRLGQLAAVGLELLDEGLDALGQAVQLGLELGEAGLGRLGQLAAVGLEVLDQGLGALGQRAGVGLQVLQQGLGLELAGLGLLGERVDAVVDLVAAVGDDALLAGPVELGLHVGGGLADQLDGVVAGADGGVERLGGGLENSGLSHQCFLLPVWGWPPGTTGRRR